MHPKFMQYLDIEKIEELYAKLILVDLNELSHKEFCYVTGALDACMAAIGLDNGLTKLLNIDETFPHEEKIEAIKMALRMSYPEAEEIMEGYTDENIEEKLSKNSIPPNNPGMH